MNITSPSFSYTFKYYSQLLDFFFYGRVIKNKIIWFNIKYFPRAKVHLFIFQLTMFRNWLQQAFFSSTWLLLKFNVEFVYHYSDNKSAFWKNILFKCFSILHTFSPNTLSIISLKQNTLIDNCFEYYGYFVNDNKANDIVNVNIRCTSIEDTLSILINM